MLHRKRTRRMIAATLLLVMLTNVLAPTVTYALTSGPTQPEATSFEPVDTTDMVNSLTGDFAYNLPLFEVPGPEGGYPLSLSYHAGIQTNEDASWVGLGWTLNPGAITRSVNGYPDDWYAPTNYSHVYWSGGTRTTFSVGVNIGLSGLVSGVSFGLSFSQDTYQGFGVGVNVGVGLKWGLGDNTQIGIGVSLGISPYGDAYLGGGVTFGIAGQNLIASAGLSVTTNFETVSGGFSGGVSYSTGDKKSSPTVSLMQASISTGGNKPSFEVGGLTAYTSSTYEASLRTSSSGWNVDIPFGVGSVSFGYNKTRYWIDDKTNVTTHGSIHASGFSVVNDHDYDTYSLLEDPSTKNIIDYPDPLKLQGGTFLNTDVYNVSAQGVGGAMRPYYFQGRVLGQNQKKSNGDPLVTFHPAGPTPSPAAFRFVNDFSNSYRQNYSQYTDPNLNLRLVTPPLDGAPVYGNGDGNYGKGTGNVLAGSRYIEIQPKIKPSIASGYIKTDRYLSNMIEGFSITNESGVTYHFGLPAYAFGEENYQKKIDESGGLYLNRSTKNTAYAYTWYLTTVTGPDFVDRNNNLIADVNDWGYWVNLEYGKWSNNYKWRNPAEGYHRDEDNEWYDCSMGTREVYYLNAIKTRTHVALFEKNLRLDAKGTSPNSFNKNSVTNNSGIFPFSQVTTFTNYQNSGIYDLNGSQSLSLEKIYLLNLSDASTVAYNSGSNSAYSPGRTITCTDCELPWNVLDKTDVDGVRSQLEAKAIRIIEFEYDYSLCAGTKNSFDIFGGFGAPNQGKLALRNVLMRGKGGTALLPPTKFDYELTGTDVVSASGTLTTTSFTSSNANFNVGDMLYEDALQVYCGMITSKTPSGGNYIYELKNTKYTLGSQTRTVRTTKNPPYNKDAYDMWGMYKGDFNTALITSNENLGRKTTQASSKGADAWSLRKIRNPYGADIKITYESDSYSTSVLNQDNSLIMKTMSILADRKTVTFNLENYAQTIESGLVVGSRVKAVIMAAYNALGISRIPFDDVLLGKFTITNISGLTYTGVLDVAFPASVSGSGSFHSVISGNISVKENGDNLGGGLRVRSVSLVTTANIVTTTYSYGHLNSMTTSSGVTTFLPTTLPGVDAAAITAGVGSQADLKKYKAMLYKNVENLYAISRELPPPGIMYEYVTVTTSVKNSDESGTRDVPGKTMYQFEVYRSNMVGREIVGTQTGSGAWGNNTVKNLVIKKFTAAIGSIRRIVQYDKDGRKLSETVNHYLHDGLERLDFTNFISQYKARLSQFSYQGYLQERNSEVKELQNSDTLNGVKATLSAKEEYPMIATGQTVINYLNGTQVKSETLGFDFYSGAVTKTVETDAYGNRTMTELVPAYRKTEYAAMGLPINAPANKNMLTQVAASYIRKVNSSNTILGVVAANVTQWSNAIPAMDAAGIVYTQNTPFTPTNGDVWRMAATYSWLPDNKTTDGLTAIANFTDFNFTTPGSSHANWKKSSEITRYDVFSHDLEGKDISGNFAANRMGYNATKILIGGVMNRYYEISFSGAEDDLVAGKFGGGVAPGNGTATDVYPTHTGHKTLRLAGGTNGDGFSYTANVSDLTNTQDYVAFVWAKNQTSGAPTLSLYYQTGAGSKVYPTNLTSGQISDGWYLYSVKIPSTAVTGGSTLKIGAEVSGNSVGVLMDDFRFQPMMSTTSAYVYDKFSGQLTHILNNNNTYSKFEYDAAGRLIRTYQETIKNAGAKLAGEFEYNYGEPVYAFSSDAIATNFTKNNCPPGEAGSEVFVSIPAGTYKSNISAAVANDKALAAAQQYANDNGTCTPATTTVNVTHFIPYEVTVRFWDGSTLVHEETTVGGAATFTVPNGVYHVEIFTVDDNTSDEYFYSLDTFQELAHSAFFQNVTVSGTCYIDVNN